MKPGKTINRRVTLPPWKQDIIDEPVTFLYYVNIMSRICNLLSIELEVNTRD